MKAKPFPVDLLPEPLKSYVSEAAVALDCDPAYIAVPLLAAVASAIGNTRRIRLKKSWSEPAVIWAATVGESGRVKSPAFELAMRPLWRRQIKLLRDHAAAVAKYKKAVEQWKEEGGSEGREKPKPPPPCEHPLCSDITVEALADRLEATPRGTLVGLDELSSWFGSFNQYKKGGADVGNWLNMHGARAIKVDRKTGEKRTILVPHAAVCVTGTIQPGTLRRVLQPEFFENGLAARLLVPQPEPRAKRWTDEEISDKTTAAVDSVFTKLFALLSSPGPNLDEPTMVDLDPGAQSTWIEFVNKHNQEMTEMVGHVRSAWAKLEGYAARFALIFHCVREATDPNTSIYVDRADIEAGIALSRWFGSETLRVYRLHTETEEQRDRRTLLDMIYKLGGRVTPRDLKEHSRRFPTSEEAELALQALVDDALGAWETPQRNARGRPGSSVFVLADSPDRPFRVPQNQDSNGKSYFPEPEHHVSGEQTRRSAS